MCGINGFTGTDEGLVERMNALTAHRGPDGVGVYKDGQVTFGHNRLAIIDTSERGAQPMESNDGSVVLIYNGMLYNYPELRLELADYPYKGESDTEVIIAAYKKWGIGCLSKFNGIFAMALWDKKTGTLYLVRDPMGIKPLYYSEKNGHVYFSSEMKALLEAGIDRTLDSLAFSHFMRLTDVLGPHTLFTSVKKLPAAHYAVVEAGKLSLTKYWSLDGIRAEKKTAKEWEGLIQETLDASVTRQLISDRPVGVFLSGGIDSSAVLASVIRAKGTARTYTTRFQTTSSDGDDRFNHDAELARKTAEHFHTNHKEITVRQDEVIALLEDATWYMDEPTGSATTLAQLALARETSKEVRVVLGGDGGDELFGGYERYRLSRWMDLYRKFGLGFLDGLHPSLRKLDTPPGFERLRLFELVKEGNLDTVLASPWKDDLTSKVLSEQFFRESDRTALATLMDTDRQLLTDGSLLRTDKLSMAAGLEARVPILDREMIELAARIPAEDKATLFTTKKLFKDAVRDRLPGYLFSEEKRGWFAPGGTWLEQKEIYEYVREVLSPSYYAPTKELFNWEGITSMLDDHYHRVRHNRALLWPLLSFQLWARRFGAVV